MVKGQFWYLENVWRCRKKTPLVGCRKKALD